MPLVGKSARSAVDLNHRTDNDCTVYDDGGSHDRAGCYDGAADDGRSGYALGDDCAGSAGDAGCGGGAHGFGSGHRGDDPGRSAEDIAPRERADADEAGSDNEAEGDQAGFDYDESGAGDDEFGFDVAGRAWVVPGFDGKTIVLTNLGSGTNPASGPIGRSIQGSLVGPPRRPRHGSSARQQLPSGVMLPSGGSQPSTSGAGT